MLLYHAGKVLARVVLRFREGRDRGSYATVVEEVLREFYFTNVGAALWGRMKRQTEYAFRETAGGPPPGGLLLLSKLAEALPARPTPTAPLDCRPSRPAPPTPAVCSPAWQGCTPPTRISTSASRTFCCWPRPATSACSRPCSAPRPTR